MVLETLIKRKMLHSDLHGAGASAQQIKKNQDGSPAPLYICHIHDVKKRERVGLCVATDGILTFLTSHSLPYYEIQSTSQSIFKACTILLYM